MELFRRILLVEDNENDVELTLDALSEFNLVNNIDIAHDGEEALEYLSKKGKFSKRNGNNPVLVLLDIKMPKYTGLEVLEIMKQDENLKTVPVVILTSSKEESDLMEGYSLGVNAYVLKPIEVEQFVRAIRAVGLFWAMINEPPPLNSKYNIL